MNGKGGGGLSFAPQGNSPYKDPFLVGKRIQKGQKPQGVKFSDTRPGKVTQMDERKHILVVDDDPGIRNSVSAFLTRSGFEVTLAQDGHHALDILPKTHPIYPCSI